jgi:hypothetical protein
MGAPQRLDNDCLRGLVDQPLTSVRSMIESSLGPQ